MTTHTIQSSNLTEADSCIALLTRGFADDPGLRWLYPEPDRYAANFPRFARALGGAAFEHATAHRVGPYLAAALWLPPGAHPDEETLGALLEESIPADRRADAFALFEQMAECHPKEPHWHLPLIATDPAHRGMGWGTHLLRHGLAECEAQGLPAYLEATSPRNAALYARLGFRTLKVLKSGDSPEITAMLRPCEQESDEPKRGERAQEPE